MRVTKAGAPLVAEGVEPPTPGRGLVRVTVSASGVCHADIGTAAASGAGTVFPVTPGHEVAGVIAELGQSVTRWQVGDRVAVGWFGGSCGQCAFCRVGDVVHCPDRQVPGRSYPGGWAQSITVPADALAAIPDGMDFFDAAPMGCAGVTTFNAIRHAHLRAGGTVAVFGSGGLGHLAIQFAAKMGYRTIAIARGTDRAELAHQLGAHHYIDSATRAPGEALTELGGADLILSTAPTTELVSDLLPGLAVHGRLTLIGVDAGTVAVPAARLIRNGQIITGHLTGSARDTEEAMQFAQTNGVRPMIERMPLEQANEAIARIAAGKPRFRIVLDATGDW
jgi:alcohol dehydrogenase